MALSDVRPEAPVREFTEWYTYECEFLCKVKKTLLEQARLVNLDDDGNFLDNNFQRNTEEETEKAHEELCDNSVFSWLLEQERLVNTEEETEKAYEELYDNSVFSGVLLPIKDTIFNKDIEEFIVKSGAYYILVPELWFADVKVRYLRLYDKSLTLISLVDISEYDTDGNYEKSGS